MHAVMVLFVGCVVGFSVWAVYWFGSCPIFMVVCVVGDLLFWLWLVALLWSFRGLLGGLFVGLWYDVNSVVLSFLLFMLYLILIVVGVRFVGLLALGLYGYVCLFVAAVCVLGFELC